MHKSKTDAAPPYGNPGITDIIRHCTQIESRQTTWFAGSLLYSHLILGSVLLRIRVILARCLYMTKTANTATTAIKGKSRVKRA